VTQLPVVALESAVQRQRQPVWRQPGAATQHSVLDRMTVDLLRSPLRSCPELRLSLHDQEGPHHSTHLKTVEYFKHGWNNTEVYSDYSKTKKTRLEIQVNELYKRPYQMYKKNTF